MARNITIDLDKPRTLFFDLEALEDLEARLGGKAFGNILQDIGALGLTAIQAALLVGLQHEDPTLSRNLVRKLMQAHLNKGGSMTVISEALNDALVATGVFRTKKEADEGKAMAERAS